MRSLATPIAIACLFATAGCITPSTQPPTTDPAGVMHFSASRVSQHVICSDHPIVLEGDRTEMTLTGGCRTVTLAGSHNDVTVDLAAGGTFDITGSHNDVNWRQVGVGPRPSLRDNGAGDAFHVLPPQD